VVAVPAAPATAATPLAAATPQARAVELHQRALELEERGDREGAEQLLAEAVEAAPGYALGHLSLGLHLGAGARAAHHLAKVLELTAGRRDDESLPGPRPLPVAWVRRAAQTALAAMERTR
jgi:hypothetical protein